MNNYTRYWMGESGGSEVGTGKYVEEWERVAEVPRSVDRLALGRVRQVVERSRGD